MCRMIRRIKLQNLELKKGLELRKAKQQCQKIVPIVEINNNNNNRFSENKFNENSFNDNEFSNNELNNYKIKNVVEKHNVKARNLEIEEANNIITRLLQAVPDINI
ncbi:hypothetical protein Glove_530g3 [Diversispora epigaea]|uniref:Uncharacterized protein n=1 Tax=Diversispora epigaea TaxID=1348612 RepID=A0A397GJ60_9GLOM|nr:hypothetical protein Glove_530g3 [Diversispora epigaea]